MAGIATIMHKLQRLNLELDLYFQSVQRMIWSSDAKQQLLTAKLLEAFRFPETFATRLNHLLFFTGQTIVSTASEDCKLSFYKLDLLQLKVLEFDLLEAVSTVDNTPAFKNTVEPRGRSVRHNAEDVFANVDELKISVADDRVSALPFEFQLLVNVFYSMDAERFVLDWFQEHPSQSESALLTRYASLKGTLAFDATAPCKDTVK